MHRLGVLLLLTMLGACAGGGVTVQGPGGASTSVPACTGFEEIARLPADVGIGGGDPERLFWFEREGRLRLAINTFQHLDVWEVGDSAPRLAYRVPGVTAQSGLAVATDDGSLLAVNRGRIPTPGSDIHIVDATTGADLRVVPPHDPLRPGGAAFAIPLPGTTMLVGRFRETLAVVDAADGRFVARRNFMEDPLPPGRMARHPTEAMTSPPYGGQGQAAATQGGRLIALATNTGQQVTLPDGRRGWVAARAVDVWTLEGNNLSLLHTIPLGGYAFGYGMSVAMHPDGRHALVGIREVQFVNEISGVSHLYYPRTAPPRLLRVDLEAGRVVTEVDSMLPRSAAGRMTALLGMALDPQGRFLALTYAGGRDGAGPDGLLLVDPVTLTPICNLARNGRFIGRSAVSRDGALLALVVDGPVRVYRIPPRLPG